ncbi:MAG TPA: tetratricopeptide repeat protein, partial [Xanthomonadales bacterium]|nr:tetratricopeptide repeat protein [Xanthomonadales bacterium]
PAYAQRGIVTDLLSETQYGTIPKAQAETQSKLFTDQALRLDPDLAEGWAAQGLWHSNRPGETDQAIAALEKALELNPNLIDAANWLNNAYNSNNEPTKAIALLEQISQRDPLYRPALGNLAFQYVTMGQRDKSRALIEKARPFMAQDANMQWLDNMMFFTAGEIAKALPLAEAAVRQQPQDRVFRISLGIALLGTAQFERASEEGYWWTQALAMQQLGRIEEATLLAKKWADAGDVAVYFAILNATDRSNELVDYLEARWPNLDAFAVAFPSEGYFGWSVMNDVALAYQRAGNQQKFDDAMFRVREAHDELARQGLVGDVFKINEATWYALAGDRPRALQYLAEVVDGGRIFSPRIATDFPAFRDLEGDPEYEAIQARMLEHLNRERAELGLEPVKA